MTSKTWAVTVSFEGFYGSLETEVEADTYEEAEQEAYRMLRENSRDVEECSVVYDDEYQPTWEQEWEDFGESYD